MRFGYNGQAYKTDDRMNPVWFVIFLFSAFGESLSLDDGHDSCTILSEKLCSCVLDWTEYYSVNIMILVYSYAPHDVRLGPQ